MQNKTISRVGFRIPPGTVSWKPWRHPARTPQSPRPSREDVDYRRTIGNNICEITQVLGIEAVRNALYKVRPQPHPLGPVSYPSFSLYGRHLFFI